MQEPSRPDGKPCGARGRWLALAALLLVVFGSAGVRIHHALTNPNFDRTSSAGILTTDPAFILYTASRIVAGGGLPPEDFRADARVEHPDGADMLARFTVGQEFLVAWKYMVSGGSPLHVAAVWVSSFTAALTALGVALLARELTTSRWWGVGAALLWAVTPASYRTMSFVIVREDLSLPLFALHLGLAMRAARTRRATDFVLAGLVAAAAAATWHAMGTFLAMEMVCLALWFLRTGENPLAPPRAWLAPASTAVAALLVPVLRAKVFLFSPPMVIAGALVFCGVLARRRDLGHSAAFAALAGVIVLLLAVGSVANAFLGTSGDYSHVTELIVAKLRHLGELPRDPNELSFDVRLLWQGPFATASPVAIVRVLGLSLLAVPLGLWFDGRAWLRGGDGRGAVLLALLVLGLLASWLIRRTLVLPAMLSGVVLVAACARVPHRRLAVALFAVTCAYQALQTWGLQLEDDSVWYVQPGLATPAERADMIAWVGGNIPSDEPIAADFLTSSGILLHTGNPILLQPKYETRRSRNRIEQFFDHVFHGTPGSLGDWMEARGCRYLVVDRPVLWGSKYVAGLPPDAPTPPEGSPAVWMFALGRDLYARLPGFELLYAGPPELRTGEARHVFPSSSFLVYRLKR